MKLIGVGVLLCAAAFASPQQTTIPILDSSQTGSPVLFSGVVTAEDRGSGVLRYSLKKNILCTNVSSKSILLMVTRVDVLRLAKIDVRETKVDDYLFALDVFEPNANETWKDSFGPFGEPLEKTDLEPQEPRAIVRAVFVQFADGSIWGDLGAGKDALRDRELTTKELRVLEDAYRTQGNGDFVSQLMKASQLAAILELQRLYADSKEAEGVIRKMDNMLNYAGLHQRAMQLGTVINRDQD